MRVADVMNETEVVALYWLAVENSKHDSNKAERARWAATADILRPMVRKAHYSAETDNRKGNIVKLTNNSIPNTNTKAGQGIADMLASLTCSAKATTPTVKAQAPTVKPAPPLELLLRTKAQARIAKLAAWAKERGLSIYRGRKGQEAVSPADCAITGHYVGNTNGTDLAMLPIPPHFTEPGNHAKDNRAVWLDTDNDMLFFAVKVNESIMAMTMTDNKAGKVASVVSSTKPLVNAGAGRYALRQLYIGDIRITLQVSDHSPDHYSQSIPETIGNYADMLMSYGIQDGNQEP